MPRRRNKETAAGLPQDVSPGASRLPPEVSTALNADALPSPSKSQRKRDAHAVQALGAQLVALSPTSLARLGLPETLYEAVVAVQGMRTHGARTRQFQYIGKLMRQLEPSALLRVREAIGPRRVTTPRAQL